MSSAGRVPSYEDVIRGRLNAQISEVASDQARRLTESHRHATQRGVSHTQFALVLFGMALADNMRSRAERFWRTVLAVKVGDDEPVELVSSTLKRLAREQFHRGASVRFLEIDQFVSRGQAGSKSPSLKRCVDGQHAKLRGIRDRLLRELDSRIDALSYELRAKARARAALDSRIEQSLSTALSRRVVDRSTPRERRKMETDKQYATWQRKAEALLKENPRRAHRWIAQQIAKDRASNPQRRAWKTIAKNVKWPRKLREKKSRNRPPR